MSKRLSDADRVETHRALIKLLQYVEDECARIGCSTSTWMVAMSRDTLQNELTAPSFLSFGPCGRPWLH